MLIGKGISSFWTAKKPFLVAQLATTRAFVVFQLVVEDQAFKGTSIPTSAEVLARLHIAAFTQDHAGQIAAIHRSGVTIYNLDANGHMTKESVFEVIDNFGRKQFRKKSESNVVIMGSNVSFRNPVHFMSLSDPEPRDAQDEG